MKYYLHADGITEECIKGLLEFINQNDGQDITIGLNSNGGSTATALFLAHVLNMRKNLVTLIAISGIYSAAFDLFYRFKGTKILARGCRGMYHYSSIDIRYGSSLRPDNEDERQKLKMLSIDRVAIEAMCAEFMTPTEMRRLRSNKDVWFDFERMREIFPHATTIGY